MKRAFAIRKAIVHTYERRDPRSGGTVTVPEHEQHRAIVEEAGGRYHDTQPHPTRGHTVVWFTEPKHGSTTFMPASELTVEKVRAHLANMRAKFEKSRALHQQFTLRGLPISVENRMGSIRSWYDPMKDEHGHTRMRNRYGYIRGTVGADGDAIDCFIGLHLEAPMVYVVKQVNPQTGKYDEDKVMIGFASEDEAKRAYLWHYDDPRFFGSIKAVPFEEFKERIKR